MRTRDDDHFDGPCLKALTVNDLPAAIEIQRTVCEDLRPGFIRPKSTSDLRGYLENTLGAAYGIFQSGVLVAMSLLRIPDENHPNDGLPFPLVPHAEWPCQACFLENTLVHPGARGRRYQGLLIDARISHAASVNIRWICAGVHLGNFVSWRNLLAKGMSIAGIRFDYGYPVIGLLRCAEAPALASDPNDQLSVAAHEASEHHAALQTNYIGVRLTCDGAVLYQRLSPQRTAVRSSE